MRMRIYIDHMDPRNNSSGVSISSLCFGTTDRDENAIVQTGRALCGDTSTLYASYRDLEFVPYPDEAGEMGTKELLYLPKVINLLHIRH